MQLNRRGWCYRIYERVADPARANLCKVFWISIAGPFLLFMAAGTVLTASIIWWPIALKFLLAALLLAGFVGAIIGVAAGVIITGQGVKRTVQMCSGSVVVEYLRAKKARVCPRIEWV